MDIQLIELPDIEKGRTREDHAAIDPAKLYLVRYSGAWLIGRFEKLDSSLAGYAHRWYFNPNLGAMGMSIDRLEAIYEIVGLPQAVDGSTYAHISGYLSSMNL